MLRFGIRLPRWRDTSFISRTLATPVPHVGTLSAVGVALDVQGLVQGSGGGVSFFVGGNFGFVLQGIADIVEAFQQDFLARRGNLEFQNQAVLVGDDLVRQIHGQRIAFFFFRALEEFRPPDLRGAPRGLFMACLSITWT